MQLGIRESCWHVARCATLASMFLLIPLVASLSLDTFAVSTAIGVAPLHRSTRMQFAGACAGVEAIMPIIGFIAGGVAGRAGAIAPWLAACLLATTGIWMLREASGNDDEIGEAIERAGKGGIALFAAAFSVGFDELAAGVALGALKQPIAPVLAAITVQALIASLLGLSLGRRLGERAGKRAGGLAGLALSGLAAALALMNLAGIKA
jgi:putative Mn2+ efflux pump MntP